MSKSFRKDLTGQRFGRLTVIEFVPNDKSRTFWKCKCVCGNVSTVCGADLKRGDVLSCGCWWKEINKISTLKHGLSDTRLYNIWKGMISRCHNPNSKDYKNYGNRGIEVCSEWRNDVKCFNDWAMTNGYADDLTIDRIDVDGNYEPSNCRWIDIKKQQCNKRNNIIVEYHGEKKSLRDISRNTGIKYVTLCRRYYKGERGEQLFRQAEK